MKISDKIKQIIKDAQAVYGISTHLNDGISVGTYFNGFEWQVWLERPSQNQLDHGEVEEARLHTIKRWDTKTALFTSACELHEALSELHERVEDGEDWE